MKFVLRDPSRLSAIHGDEELMFDLSTYKQTYMRMAGDSYADINAWFEAQPIETQAVIFGVYKEISMAMLEVRDMEFLGDMLERYVEVIYRYVTWESVYAFCNKTGRAHIPQGTFKDAHDPNDKVPDRTYLTSDCKNLAVLAICLRPLVPIWSRYTQIIDKLVGNNFKEQIAVSRLISGTWIMDSIPVNRLRPYITVFTSKENLAAATFDSISKEEFPEWLLSLILVRKVCVGDITISSDRGSLISGIFNFISQMLKGLDGRFMRVGDKKATKSSSIDDDIGVLDDSRVRQNDTIGSQTARELITENIYGMARFIDPTIPLDLVLASNSAVPDFTGKGLSEFHLRIIQYVVAKEYPAVQIDALSKQYRINLLLAARALLWHWGHKELSLLLSAPMPPIEGDEVIEGIGSNHRTRVKPELVEEMLGIYKYGPSDASAIREGRASKNTNYYYRATVLLKDLLPNRLWRTVPIPGTDTGGLVDMLGMMSTPEDIHSLIVKLVIDIGQRRSK